MACLTECVPKFASLWHDGQSPVMAGHINIVAPPYPDGSKGNIGAANHISRSGARKIGYLYIEVANRITGLGVPHNFSGQVPQPTNKPPSTTCYTYWVPPKLSDFYQETNFRWMFTRVSFFLSQRLDLRVLAIARIQPPLCCKLIHSPVIIIIIVISYFIIIIIVISIIVILLFCGYYHNFHHCPPCHYCHHCFYCEYCL